MRLRKPAFVFVLMIILLMGFGCGQAVDEGQQAPEDQKVEEGKQQVPENQPETRTESGTFIGQIDANSIEIKISGVPEEESNRAFKLSAEIKERFEELGLETGDEVLITYIPKENEQPEIIELKKNQ